MRFCIAIVDGSIFLEKIIFEKQMVDAESKLGINPLELWMNEMIDKKRKQKMENEEEQ